VVPPLPLVPFESYMLADHRPAYPMNSLVRLHFSGRFDRATLETALSTALSRHPLLTALVCGPKRRRIWRPAEHPPTIQWLDALPAESLPGLPPLDVRVAPGMRVAVCEGAGQTHMILQAHHACCDGLGMFGFAEDLLTAYAIARGVAAAPALRPLRPELLAGRGRFDMTTPRLLKVCPNPFPRLDGLRRFLLRAPEPLVAHQPQAADHRPPPAYPASLTRRLDEVQTGRILAAAKALGVTLNDLLARELFLTLGWWRQRHAPGQPDGWLRLCVPMNLRTAAQDQLPAANVVSMVFLDRRNRDLRDPQRLLASLHDQMQRIKRLQLGPTFVRSVGLCRRWPGLLERMCRARRCLATVVFTNLGILFQRCPLADRGGPVAVDGLVLQDMDLLPPLRPLTCAAFTAWSYARRLYFTLHYDPRVLAEHQARELIDGLIDRLPLSSRPADRGTQV
jgi:hypothetical protein